MLSFKSHSFSCIFWKTTSVLDLALYLKIFFFNWCKNQRNCRFGFSVVLQFFSYVLCFFWIFFRIVQKKVRFSVRNFYRTSKVVKKTRTHGKNWKNVHFFENTVSLLFPSVKKKISHMVFFIDEWWQNWNYIIDENVSGWTVKKNFNVKEIQDQVQVVLFTIVCLYVYPFGLFRC